MSQYSRVPARLIAAAVLVLCGCAAPTSGESTSDSPSTPATSETAPPSESQAPTTTAAPTTIAPSDPPEASAQAEPGQGEWPPELIFTDLKEAGATEVVVDGVRVQVPAGFTANATAAASGTTQLDGTGPGASGTGTVSVTSTPAGGQDASALLAAYEPAVVRSGPVDVPGAASAAIGERIADGTQTWVLVVVTPAGAGVTAVFSATVADFDALLLAQSLCSTKVVG